MRTSTTSFTSHSRAFVATQPMTSQSMPTALPHPPTRRPSFMRSKQNSPAPRNEVAQFFANIDGVSVLVRFLVADIATGIPSDFVSKLEKTIGRIAGSSLRPADRSKPALASVEFIPSAEHLAPSTSDTVLRVGALEIDLLDRSAKRGERRIDLRPREFQLLKYMMERSDRLLTRAALLKDVWNYKFVPKTNLVDVHMGRLRRKIDGPNESPLIRNVRGVGFVLDATPFCRYTTPGSSE
jgi:DNA-binding winged helix-turn-helix (wHTH) protein